MPYAALSDVEVDFGPVPPEDVDKVAILLERAEARIRQDVPDLDERVTDGRSPVVLVKQVESEMVVSVLRNPGGYQSESTSLVGISTSYTLSLAAASGLLRLTPEHRAMLGVPRSSGRGGRAFTVSPGG